MLPSLRHPLTIESSGDDAPFRLESAICTVGGSERLGISDVALDDRRVLGACRVANAPCTAFRISPLGIERELRSGTIAVVERTVVCPSEPAIAIEWVAESDVELTLEIRERAADVVMSHTADRVSLSAHQPRLLLVSLASPVTTEPQAWVRSHQAAAHRRDAELLRAAFPLPELNGAVSWAEFRLRSIATPSGRYALALMAAGEQGQLPQNLTAALDHDWPDFAAGQTNAALERWRTLALGCYEGEKGAWPDEPGQSAADVITGLVYGMLGFHPDAARERLRLRPQFPTEYGALSIRNLALGDALIEVEYTRLESGSRFTVEQVAGAYPLRLIFEPTLTEVPARIVVDGRNAQLDLAPFGERIVAPVQIMLDDRRTVEFYS